ncbi:MAG: HAD family hydrolase [Rhizobiales bacterium]|nr:HAD family hydrolase [Hyphomicrobiales bacterium]
MWSGPRNISTAMMYAFGNRPDCVAWDEPFYAFSLVHHGNDHPMREEIIAANDSDWDALVARCTGPASKPLFYQKHMTHHMLPGYDRSWITKLSNAFLIRSPERVLASYARKWPDVTLRDIGFVEQAEIFDQVAQHTGKAPPVIDAEDVLEHPHSILTKLCEALRVPFHESMLRWPKGLKPFDGVWAPHWYNAVWASTGFAKPEATAIELPAALAKIADAARPYYEKLWNARLT